MNLLELPHLGFMEQTVATPLIRALIAVGDFKPKYPFLTATRSALIYVAYHLKGKFSISDLIISITDYLAISVTVEILIFVAIFR